jgi:hypothetical protein
VAVAAILPWLTACQAASPSPVAHASHGAASEPLKTDLAINFGMAFAPAGPHHQIGRAADGVELDLIGLPVEEIVLSLPSADVKAAVEAGRAYLPHLHRLMGGADSVWEWLFAGLACRERTGNACEREFAAEGLTARFTDVDPHYLVMVVTRE